jgi:hypothetical protein
MVDAALLKARERFTSGEQQTPLGIAEQIVDSRNDRGNTPKFDTPGEGLSPARQAARRFMRENPELMRLLAQ